MLQGEKTPRKSLPEREKTPGTQLSVDISVFIPDCSEDIKVRARLQKIAHMWEQKGAYQLTLLQQGTRIRSSNPHNISILWATTTC